MQYQIELTRLKTGRESFIVNVGYAHVNFCRAIPKAYYNKERKVWIASVERMNAAYFLENEHLFTQSPEVKTRIKNLVESNKIPYKPCPTFDLKTSPKRHQVRAYDKLWNLDFAALFMGMGSGKTKTAIDLLRINEHKFDKVLIICPLSVRHNWTLQLQAHDTLKMPFYVYEYGTKKHEKEYKDFLDISGKKVMIIGAESLAYKTLPGIAIEYVKSSPTAIVFDESHLIKNPGSYAKTKKTFSGSTRTANAIWLAKHSVLRYILTGTSISEGIENLFSQFTFLSPNILGTSNYYALRNRYVVFDSFEKNTVIGYKNLNELHSLIDRYCFVCKKDDVVDLPPKNKTVRYLDLLKEQKDVLTHFKRTRNIDLPGKTEKSGLVQALSMCGILQQINAGYYVTDDKIKTPIFDPKKDPKINEIIDILDGRSFDSGVVIFAKYIYEIQNIYNQLREKYRCEVFYGDTDMDKRGQIVADFESGKIDILIVNPRVGGTGIELIRADLMIYYSNSFSYVDRIQSEDRAHRIGQNKVVTYIDLIYKGTIDEKILRALESKKSLSELLTSDN